MIVPVFLPHLGCEKRCIYCNQDIITDVDAGDLASRIETNLASRGGTFEVGLYGGNVFGIKPEVLRRLFSSFKNYRENITHFRISTQPVPLDDKVIAILKENRVTTIELGIPTFNDTILAFLNRQHTKEDLVKAFYLLTEQGFQVALQVMVGLPYETMADIKDTAENVNLLKPAFIRIYPLAFLRGTPLARMYETGQFAPITFDEAVYRAMFIYLNTLRQGVKTVKMGLTDNEVIKDRIVGGYYHPAFGFLVKSEAFYRAVSAKMADTGLEGELAVFLNSRDIPHLLGHKRANIRRFHEAGVSITWQTADISQGTFVIKKRGMETEGTIFDGLSGQ